MLTNQLVFSGSSPNFKQQAGGVWHCRVSGDLISCQGGCSEKLATVCDKEGLESSMCGFLELDAKKG